MLRRRIARWAVNAVAAGVLVLATTVLIYALQARRQADLQPWHTQAHTLEMTAADIGPGFSLAQYRERENALFDLNRQAAFSTAFKPADRAFLRTLFTGEPRAYRLAIVTNANPGTGEAVEKSAVPGSRNLVEEPTGLVYPPGVFSLSHGHRR